LRLAVLFPIFLPANLNDFFRILDRFSSFPARKIITRGKFLVRAVDPQNSYRVGDLEAMVRAGC